MSPPSDRSLHFVLHFSWIREMFFGIFQNRKVMGWEQGFVKGEVFCFRYPYFYFRHGEITFQASQLTYTAGQLSKDLNKVPLLLQNLGWEHEPC